jgi:hypothetical protein
MVKDRVQDVPSARHPKSSEVSLLLVHMSTLTSVREW